ncbi:MAG TPA: DUF2231 domain-containing protein [Gemmatirosa sp.]
MPPRLHEIHPAIVHFPIAVLPIALGADLLGRVTGSRTLSDVGRALMPLAAAGAAVSAATGLIAQQEVSAEGVAGDILVTHRNLNLSLTAITALMAVSRWSEDEAGAGYLALGLAGLGALSYSAYLGSKMVYEHGVGVKPADGLAHGESPALSPSEAPSAARRALADLKDGAAVAVADVRAGRLAPAIGESLENPTAAPPRSNGRHADAAPWSAGRGTDSIADHGAGSPETLP